MSFLTPLYIAGIAAVGLPILFHLIRRTPRARFQFSSLAFLSPSPPKVSRRSRIEHWLLLVLRGLALCLLALAFARPFIREEAGTTEPANDGRRLVILVDTSASMRRRTLWSEALNRVESLLKKTTPNDDVAVYTFDRQLEPVITFAEWSSHDHATRLEIARRKLSDRTPGWGATELGDAMISAAESFQPARDGSRVDQRDKKIVLVSDLQSGSRRNSLREYPWPGDVKLVVDRVVAKDTTNAGVQLASGGSELADVEGQDSLRVRITNAEDSKLDQFRVQWIQQSREGKASAAGAWLDAYVPAGQARIVRIPAVPTSEMGLRVVLEGDAHEFDNTVYVDPPTAYKITVLYIGSEPADDPSQPRYYVERAFLSTPLRTVEVRTPDEYGPAPWTPIDVPLIIASETPSEAGMAAIRPCIQSGGNLLILARTASDCARFSPLLGIPPLEAREAELDGYAMLAEIDFSHPLFAPFAESRFADFTGIHFWKHRSISPDQLAGGVVLASFDDGDPAIVEFTVGSGRVFLALSGWHPQDSQLALSSRFAPLLNAILETGAGAHEQPVYVEVGEPFPVPPESSSGSRKTLVRAPDNREILVEPSERVFAGTDLPGIYSVSTPSQSVRRTVNLAPDESKTDPLPLEALEALGVRMAPPADDRAAVRVRDRQRQMHVQELEREQKLWRWLLLAVVIVLLGESWLGRKTALSELS